MLKFVQAIERALRALSSLAGKLLRHEEDTGRRVTAKLDTDYALDVARNARAVAQRALDQWEVDHPWRMLKARAIHSEAGLDHPEWQRLTQQVQRHNQHVQDLKGAVVSHRSELDDLAEQEASLKNLRARSTVQLQRAVSGFIELGPALGPTLLSVVPEDERGWVQVVLPEQRKSYQDPTTQPHHNEVLDVSIPRLRPAPIRRPTG